MWLCIGRPSLQFSSRWHVLACHPCLVHLSSLNGVNAPNKSEPPSGTGLSQTGTDSGSDVSGTVFARKTYMLCPLLQWQDLTHAPFHFGIFCCAAWRRQGGEWQKAGGTRNPTERVYRESRAASPWPQCYSKSLRVVARPRNDPKAFTIALRPWCTKAQRHRNTERQRTPTVPV